jgi:hypothetical protein
MWWSSASKHRRAALTPGYVVKIGFGLGTGNSFWNLFGYPASGWRTIVPIHRGVDVGIGRKGSGTGLRLYVWFVIFL